jgi:hypothetical protein
VLTGWNRCPSNNLKGRSKTLMTTKTATVQDIQKKFEQAGFTVSNAPGDRIEVQKLCFVAYLAKQRGTAVYIQPPYLIFNGLQCELEDRGYQKFWFAKAENKRFPIRKSELFDLHHFDEEVRFILGVTDLYNEALGSTNACTVYDRLSGRADR